MKPAIPLHDPRFAYIPAATHDADSTAFRERQRARMKAAQAKPSNVKPIKRNALRG